MSDKERLDFLERCNGEALYTGRCLFRWSKRGRGWRLHESSGEGYNTVRDAIDAAIEEASDDNESMNEREKERVLRDAWVMRTKLHAEGDKLCTEGNKLWAEAVLLARGNVTLEWKNWSEEHKSYECHLGTGEVFRPGASDE